MSIPYKTPTITQPFDAALGQADYEPTVQGVASGMPPISQLMQSPSSGSAPIMTSKLASSVPATDWTGVAGAGIQGAGAAASGIAQAAAFQQALNQRAAMSEAARTLNEQLVKSRLEEGQHEFQNSSGLQSLLWELSNNHAKAGTVAAGRDVRRQDEQALSDVLSRIYMPRRK